MTRRATSSPGKVCRLLPAAALAVMLLGCGGSPSSGASTAPELLVTRAQTGDADWPLTVDQITLHCQYGQVTGDANGVTYAINGTARGFEKDNGWTDFHKIWAADPDGDGLKKDIGPLIQQGLALCTDQ